MSFVARVNVGGILVLGVLLPASVLAQAMPDPCCGPNTLYMMLRMHGQDDVTYQRISDELSGERYPSLLSMQNVARRHSLHASAYRCDVTQLHELQLPAIAHWHQNTTGLSVASKEANEYGHFVLLTSVSEDGVHIVDGTSGARTPMSWKSFEDEWSGHILGVTPRRHSTAHWVAVVLVGVLAGLFYLDVVAKPKLTAGDAADASRPSEVLSSSTAEGS